MTRVSFAVAALALLLGGCASGRAHFALVDPALVERPEPADYPDAHWVVLKDAVRYATRWSAGGDPAYTIERHLVVAVLSEQGVNEASAHAVPLGRHDKLVSLTARVIGVDGSVRVLGEEALHQEVLFEDRKSGARAERRVFRFPDVRPGSVLELHYVEIAENRLMSWLDDRPMWDVPVKRYEVRIEGDRRLKFAFKAYNMKERPTLTRRGRNWFIALMLQDLPARKKEHDAPDGTLVEPWWVYRTQQAVYSRGASDMYRTWEDVFTRRAKAVWLDSDGLFDDFESGLDVSGCPDARCTIEAAWSWVRERTKHAYFTDWQETPIEDVVAAGEGGSFSRSVLLWHLLREAGLQAYPAAAKLKGSGHLDQAWPSLAAFNHHLVYLPAQPGLTEPLWLDPACEYCAPGAVPDWIHGGAALVYSARTRLAADPVVEATWREVAALEAPLGAVRRRGEWTLGAGGDVTGEVAVQRENRFALDWSREVRERSAADHEKLAREQVTERLETGRLVSFEAATCERAAGRCTEAVEMNLSGFAAVTGDRMLVPLRLLERYDDRFLATERHHDLMFHTDHTIEEVAVVTLPPGWRLAERPADAEVSSPAYVVRLSVEEEGDRVVVRRTLTTIQGRHPASEYARIRAAYRAFLGLRGDMLVLRRTGAEAEEGTVAGQDAVAAGAAAGAEPAAAATPPAARAER